MFSSGDTVEEIATNRRGTVGECGIVGQPPIKWIIHFHDGKQPLVKDFTDANELRLIKGRGEEISPRLIPKYPVV